jgi:hypothetical protein
MEHRKPPDGHQKSKFSTSKVKKANNSYGVYLAEFVSSTQNHKKMIETPNQPIETKNFLKKSMFSTSKVNRSQKFV